MKIAIIGAGGSGLSAARNCLTENHEIEIFEQTKNIGGTWNYTENSGLDENGIPIHSSMYKGLKTNLPKEVMAFEEYPYPEQKESYISQEQVLEYLNKFAETFNIFAHVKFLTRVVNVEPRDQKWLLEYENVRDKQKNCGFYDAVIVCNGHNFKPFVPEISGIESFKGCVKHSHDYRHQGSYKNKRVLVVGAGPSGSDISTQIGSVAENVYVSCKGDSFLPLMNTVVKKPLIEKIKEGQVFFKDGSIESVDEILFCTGYSYDFDFLSEQCAIKVVENYVSHLYKQVINIENPTMAFIGLPFKVCPFPIFDIQVRFFLSTLSGYFKLPSKEEMLNSLQEEISLKSNRPQKEFHCLGEAQGDYFEDLAKTAGIKKIPPVIHSLYMRVRVGRNLNDCFKIINDDTWVQI